MKRKYIKPVVDRVKLDNEIALILNSNPPIGPDEDFGHNAIRLNVFKA